jgi:hypothetical protein
MNATLAAPTRASAMISSNRLGASDAASMLAPNALDDTV